MKQRMPTRPVETDRECPACGDQAVQRIAETATPSGRVVKEIHSCDGCGHGWREDAPAGLYR